MDVPEERRAWQILQGNYQEPPDGKKQDYTSIIAKAMTGYYDRKEGTHLTHEELLAKVQESIQREAEEIKKSFIQTPFPMMYPYMPIPASGMQNGVPEKSTAMKKAIGQGRYSPLSMSFVKSTVFPYRILR